MKTIAHLSFSCFALALFATSLFATEPTDPTEPKTTSTVNDPSAATPAPHCEVPCGVYGDQRRFEEMLEDTKTIAKCISSIVEISDGMQKTPPSAKSLNQLTRWVTNKEAHATNIQQIAAQYFLTQRIKADGERYEENLKAAHNVIVKAMKCKQDANPETAAALKLAIGQLYRAYEGKDPEFETDHTP